MAHVSMSSRLPAGRVMQQLSTLDRYLTLWIFLRWRWASGWGFSSRRCGAFQYRCLGGDHQYSIAIGLIVMMYPPLAKVRYEELGDVFRNWNPWPLPGAELGDWPGAHVRPRAAVPARISRVYDGPHSHRPRALYCHGHCVERAGAGDTDYAAGLWPSIVCSKSSCTAYAYVFITVLPLVWHGGKPRQHYHGGDC